MKPSWQAGPEFAVLGLVNLDAVPPDQVDIPMIDWDPYPLVLFHAADTPKQKRLVRKKRPRKPKPKWRK